MLKFAIENSINDNERQVNVIDIIGKKMNIQDKIIHNLNSLQPIHLNVIMMNFPNMMNPEDIPLLTERIQEILISKNLQ